MSAKVKLRIPKSFQAGFIQLLNLNTEKAQELQTALEEAVPTLYGVDLSPFVASQVSLDKLAVEEIIPLLLSLYQVRSLRNIEIAEFVDDVCESLENESNSELKPKDGNWAPFKIFLTSLLELEHSLGVTAKAFDVMSQHEHVYVNLGTRVLTDIRPVFQTDSTLSPSAAVIIHTLKIVYHEGNENKNFYVALDNKDIQELRQLLNRADKKAQLLQTMLKATSMQYLAPEGHKPEN